MENPDLIWHFAFLILLIPINVIYHLIDKSLREKPLRSQSIYDSAIRDTFKACCHTLFHDEIISFQNIAFANKICYLRYSQICVRRPPTLGPKIVTFVDMWSLFKALCFEIEYKT